MAIRPLDSKFEINRLTQDKNRQIYKTLDAAATFRVFPDIVDFAELNPVRRRVAAYSRPHIIGEDGSLMRVFEDRAAIEDMSGDYIRWKLYTENADVRSFFSKNYLDAGTKAGISEDGELESFPIGLDTDILGPNDIFVFERFRDFPFRVVSDPIPDGDVFKYEVVIQADDIDYVELDMIDLGTRIVQTGSPIPEATERRGNVTIEGANAYVEFEVPKSRMGWSMEVTDKAWMNAEDFLLEATDPDVQRALMDEVGSPNVLFSELEEKFWRATNRMIDMSLTYGRSSGKFAGQYLDDLNQRELVTAPGLYEFLESGWTDEYHVDTFNLDILRNFIKPIWLNKVDISDRVLHIYTGSGGLELVQKACRAEDIDRVDQPADLHYGMEEGYFEGRQGVVLGKKQYVGFHIEPFGTVYFHYLPFLDNTAIDNRKYNGYGYDSYQMIAFDFGYGDIRDDSNIKIIRDSSIEQYGYGIGGWGPFGPALSGNPKHAGMPTTMRSKNSYEMIREVSLGFLIQDVSNIMFLQPALK